jgi:hypothetical protein
MMGMGGGATMVSDGDFLYVLQGGQLFKVAKGDLTVKAKGSLPMPQPQNPGGPTAPPPPETDAIQ